MQTFSHETCNCFNSCTGSLQCMNNSSPSQPFKILCHHFIASWTGRIVVLRWSTLAQSHHVVCVSVVNNAKSHPSMLTYTFHSFCLSHKWILWNSTHAAQYFYTKKNCTERESCSDILRPTFTNRFTMWKKIICSKFMDISKAVHFWKAYNVRSPKTNVFAVTTDLVVMVNVTKIWEHKISYNPAFMTAENNAPNKLRLGYIRMSLNLPQIQNNPCYYDNKRILLMNCTTI